MGRRMRFFLRFCVLLFVLGIFGALAAAGVGIYGLWHYGRDLPDYKQLADYEPPTVTRLHAGDGRLIAEYAKERRVFVPVAAMPRRVKQAFIAAEDQNFYSHYGVDFVALARAIERKALRLRSLTIHQNPAGQRAKDALQAAGDDVNARIKVR